MNIYCVIFEKWFTISIPWIIPVPLLSHYSALIQFSMNPLNINNKILFKECRAMVKKFRWQEIRRKLWTPSEPPSPRLFSEPQWQGHVSLWYILYRWFILGCWLAFIFCSIFDIGSKKPEGGKHTWPIYLTHWDLVLGAAQAFFGALIVTRRHSEQRKPTFDPDSLTLGKIERLYWVLYTVTSSTAICVTIIYWSTIYDPKIHVKDPLNFMLHLFNTVLMLLDLIIVGVPIRVEHFWWPLVCGVIYILFTVIYYHAGGLDKHGDHYIYKILDWKRPGRTVLMCIGTLLFLTTVHCLLCSMARLRTYVRSKATGKIVTMSMVNQQNIKTETQFSTVAKPAVELIIWWIL